MKLSDEHRAVVTMFHIQGCPTRRSVRSCVFRRNSTVRGSSTRIGNCKNYLDEFRKTLFLNPALKWTNLTTTKSRGCFG